VSSGLLEGVTVVDLTQALAGPLRHAHARTRSGSAKGSEPRLSKGLEQGDRDLVNLALTIRCSKSDREARDLRHLDRI
jgi:hypothetical protein